MAVVLQYFEGCPNWRHARDLVQRAMTDVGLAPDGLVLQAMQTEQAARAVGFRGSPTVLVDGVDPFADADADSGPGEAAAGLSCRLYGTPDGPAGTPSLGQLVSALQRRR